MDPLLLFAIDDWAKDGHGLVALAEVRSRKMTVVTAPAAQKEAVPRNLAHPGLACLQTGVQAMPPTCSAEPCRRPRLAARVQGARCARTRAFCAPPPRANQGSGIRTAAPVRCPARRSDSAKLASASA